jgi:polyhydroxyalkanoate synthase subunit PhaC
VTAPTSANTGGADGGDDLAIEAALLAGGPGAVVGPSPFVGFGARDAVGGLVTLGKHSVSKPWALAKATPRTLWQVARIGTGRSPITPDAKDKRFRDSAWEDVAVLRALMQLYLYLGREADEFVESLGMSDRDVERVEFVVGLIRESLAPTNNVILNPAAVRKAKETKGASLVAGLNNLIRDIRENHGMPSQVNRDPFKVGINLAVTPGAVIYRNDVMEVIQYSSQSPTVGTRPLLVIPPQVNKYYALDLAPGRSMYEYLVQHGIQLFGISWRNPTSKERDWSFDTYAEAALEAIDVVTAVTGSDDVNLMGGCAGGMMVSILTAVLAARGDTRIHSATTLVTLLDSRVDAEILLFASDQSVKAAKLQSSRTGVLDGWRMGQVFAWLRPNELVWNYWVNNYLLGNSPPSFDILAWNADTTRLPAAFHHQLLDIVVQNQLIVPGRFTLLGTPVDLGKITVDMFVVAGLPDHITPWHGCYHTVQLVSGQSEFVLCSGGHVQTLVSAPGHRGQYYFTNPATPPDPNVWQAGAERHEGTWWDRWVEWLGERSGPMKRPPRQLGNAEYPAKEPAPGLYIHS